MKTEYKEGELLEFNENGDTKLFGLEYTQMVYVEKGTFKIGDNNSGIYNEKEATITLDSAYFIGKYPVTQGLYQHITGKNPSNFKGKHRPVERVAWNDICVSENCFLTQLNAQIKDKYPIIRGYFELPSEAQWEYAAIGGKAWDKSKLLYAGSSNIYDVAWFGNNSNKRTMPVGLKIANVLGLFDMSGNVKEWCKDFYIYDYKLINGENYQKLSSDKILRGGYWSSESESCRITSRSHYYPEISTDNFGFRLILIPIYNFQ